MMISESDKQHIREISEKYHAKRVLLFGSSLDSERESRDIDLAVEGVRPEEFFAFYGDLLFALSKPVDVIDLSRDSGFVRLIRREGVPVYG